MGRTRLKGERLPNLSAVVESVRNERRVEILCAGTDGRLTREDTLAAGAVVHQLCGTAEPPADSSEWRPNESARSACRDWQRVLAAARESGRTVSEQLALELRSTPGGRNLLDIGLDGDLVDCAAVDRLDVVPELNVRAWRITLT
jgi:2-phosphosulfolactate phosphatase